METISLTSVHGDTAVYGASDCWSTPQTGVAFFGPFFNGLYAHAHVYIRTDMRAHIIDSCLFIDNLNPGEILVLAMHVMHNNTHIFASIAFVRTSAGVVNSPVTYPNPNRPN